LVISSLIIYAAASLIFSSLSPSLSIRHADAAAIDAATPPLLLLLFSMFFSQFLITTLLLFRHYFHVLRASADAAATPFTPCCYIIMIFA